MVNTMSNPHLSGSQMNDVPEPEVKLQVERLHESLGRVNDAVLRLSERLSYVSTPAPGEAKGEKAAAPMPTRSPLAHTLACNVEEADRLADRLLGLYRSLEV